VPEARATVGDYVYMYDFECGNGLGSGDKDVQHRVGSGDDGTIYYVLAGSAVTCDLNFGVNYDVPTLTTTGTVKSITPSSDVPFPQIAPNAKSITFGYLDVEDYDMDVTLTLNAPAAGVTDTVSFGGEKAYFIGVAAGVTGKPSATKSWINTSCEPWIIGTGYRDETINNRDIGGGGAACSDTIYVDASTGWVSFRVETEDAYGNGVDTGYFLYASLTSNASGVAGVQVQAADYACDRSDVDSGECDHTSQAEVDPAMWICVSSLGVASKPITLTVTVGSLTYTRKIGFLGKIASLSLSGPAAIASIGADSLESDFSNTLPEIWGDSFVVVAKDSACNIIGNGGGEATSFPSSYADPSVDSTRDTKRDFCNNDNTKTPYSYSGGWSYYCGFSMTTDEDGDMGYAGIRPDYKESNDGVDFVVTDGDGLALTQFDTNGDETYSYADGCDEIADSDDYETSFLDEGCAVAAGADSYAFAEPANGAYNVPTDLCDADSAGQTRKIHVVDNATGVVSSNTITVACVEYDVKLTDVTASGTSVSAGGKITYTFTATDGAGHPVGDGAMVDVHVVTSAGDSTKTLQFMGGTATYKFYPGNTAQAGDTLVSFYVNDNDHVATGAQPWSKSFTASVTSPLASINQPSIYKSTVVKARAVAIFPGKGGAKVKFEVENANTGVVRTYVRKATSAGKAWYTVAAKGTFYITAYLAANEDMLTETLTIKK
jgi:hypothetical protein